MTEPARAGRRRLDARLAALLAVAACGTSGGPAEAPRPAVAAVRLEPQRSGTEALLQAVSAVNDSVAWVGGHRGTWGVTTDGGRTWRTERMPGADTLQFRDVYALDARTAWLLAAGPGEMSRIYHTADAGRTWMLQFLNRDPEAFFDCLDFWDPRRGAAFSDAVQGRFVVLTTADGGATWTPVPGDRLPPAQPGEGGFAASGTCLTAGPDGRGWIGTGNAPAARVLRTTDFGRSWTAAATPIPGAEASGVTSVAFRDARHGLVLGGHLTDTSAGRPNVARSEDGGATWTAAAAPTFPGAVFGGAWVPGSRVLVAVGPGGAAFTADGGRSWAPVDTAAYWGLDFASARAGWLVGPGGRITRVTLDPEAP